MKRPHFGWLIATALILISLLLAPAMLAQGDDDDDGGLICPRSQGFWVSRLDLWPVNGFMLGAQFYTQAELVALLPGGGTGGGAEADASVLLAAQLMAAKLNIAAGAEGMAITTAILQADALLARYSGKLPYNLSPASADGQQMISFAGVFDIYNNGQLTPDCLATPSATSTATPTATSTATMTTTATLTPTASPTTTSTAGPSPTPSATPNGLPVTIIIEGPVQVVNINIITIYDIDIEIDDDDPILNQINVGDFVRVEGNFVNSATTVVIVAVTVYVIDIDIVVTNGNVIIWQDDGANCGNSPPPWAPANGWRRRCEQPPVVIIPGGGSGGSGGGGRGGDDDDDDD